MVAVGDCGDKWERRLDGQRHCFDSAGLDDNHHEQHILAFVVNR